MISSINWQLLIAWFRSLRAMIRVVGFINLMLPRGRLSGQRAGFQARLRLPVCALSCEKGTATVTCVAR
jgi:hypothetical protein